jgi:hypothetical protein
LSVGDYEEGKRVLEEGLGILVEVVSFGDLKVARSYEVIGIIDFKMGREVEGRRKVEYAFEVKKKLGYEDGHKEILQIKAILGFFETGPVVTPENVGVKE